MWACYKGRTEVAEELLARNANPNVKGEVSALKYNCMYCPIIPCSRYTFSSVCICYVLWSWFCCSHTHPLPPTPIVNDTLCTWFKTWCWFAWWLHVHPHAALCHCHKCLCIVNTVHFSSLLSLESLKYIWHCVKLILFCVVQRKHTVLHFVLLCNTQ